MSFGFDFVLDGVSGLQGDRVGFYEFEQFKDLLEIVKFEDVDSWEDFEKEFEFLIENGEENEFLETNEKIVRSDLERNL